MYKWNENYNWIFAAGCVDSVGPNESDTGIFEGHPYKGLAKEILQNSLDAKDPKLPESQPVLVEFSCEEITADEIPGFDRLQEIIGLCADYYNTGDDGEKTQRWKRYADGYRYNNKIPILKISDYYTHGLRGVKELKGTDWSGLVREKGATNKSEGQGGSHGVGKFAPYSFSSLRTILYSTMNTDGETAFQGKTILTSFMEDEIIYHNVGVFGLSGDPKKSPVFDLSSVPDVFKRERPGTDVIVVGFEKDENWKEQIAISVLQYCFYAIHLGRLIVRIHDNQKVIEIRQDNLGDRMAEFEKWHNDNERTDTFSFTAPDYYKILTHPKLKHYDEPFLNKGNVELYLVVDPELNSRSIYEMRTVGLGIQEDSRWRGINSHFAGLFIATGKNSIDKRPENNIDSFLRKCEDAAHNEWTSSFYADHQKEAKDIIDKIHKWIREKISAELPKLDGSSHDAFGLSEYLKNTYSIGDEDDEEDAFSNYEPLTLEKRLVKDSYTKVPVRRVTNGRGKGTHSKRKPSDGSGNPHPDNKRGSKSRVSKRVNVGQIWAPFRNGEYHICFNAPKDYRDLMLKIFVGGDEQASDVAFVQNALLDGKPLNTYYGTIEVGDIEKEKMIEIIVSLENNERRGLEVQAYAK